MNYLNTNYGKYGVPSPLALDGIISSSELNNWFYFSRNLEGVQLFNLGSLINTNFNTIKEELSLVKLYNSCNEIKTK